MSLSIHVWYIDSETGKQTDVDLESGGENLAGFERDRDRLWSASIMDELGLMLMPVLRHANILVWDSALNDLEQEASIILENSEIIGAALNRDADEIAQYANNFIKAVTMAREVNGTIRIG